MENQQTADKNEVIDKNEELDRNEEVGKNEETDENPLFHDFPLKKDKTDDGYELYSSNPDLIDCDICGVCVADLAWHKLQEHNFVIKKEPMDYEEMETIIEDPFAIPFVQSRSSWVRMGPVSDGENFEVYVVLDESM